MGVVRKPMHAFSRSDSDWRLPKAQVTKSPKSFAGFIFCVDKSSIPDLDRNVFGLPERFHDSVRCIRKGMPLFLFNHTNRNLHGVFEAASDGGFNIDPYAWESTDRQRGRLGRPGSRYPAQVRVCIREQWLPLDERKFGPILEYQDGCILKLDLNADQVRELLRLFRASMSSERELPAVGRNGQNRPIGAIGFRDSESPRLAYKSDSEYFSDCSSRGMNSGEDDWPEESAGEKVHYNQREEERLHLGRVSLTDSMTYASGHIDMPSSLDEQPTGCGYNREESWKESFQEDPHCFESDYDSRVVLRLHENDPAVNSNSNTHMQGGVDHPILVNGMDNLLATPMLPSQAQFSFTGNEKMILLPVQTVQCQQADTGPHTTQSEGTKWNNQTRTSRVSSINSQKPGHSQRRSKDTSYQKQHALLDSQQSSHIHPQKLQMNQVLVSFCAQGPGQLGDQGQVTTVLSPMFVPSNGTVAITQLQMGGRVDGSNEGFEAAADVHMLPERLQQLLRSGQGQIVLVPQILPRPPPPALPAGSITAELVDALHFEILHFARWTRPSPEIQIHVEAAIDCVRRGVKMVWPEADVEVFGSFATGLCLQHSDVDLAVVDAPRLPGSDSLTIAQVSATLIRKLAAGLQEHEWCESINPLDTASMPVLKCLCRPFGASSSTPAIAVDITIGGTRNTSCPDQATRPGKFITRHTGGAARDYVLQKIQELPALAPLVLLLKSFLHHKGLSNVYTGGLGSFSLTLLVAFFLERIPSRGGCAEGRTSLSPASPLPSTLSHSSELSDDSDTPSSSSSLGAISSNNAIEGEGSQSLGELFVRRAAGTIERVLSLWDQRPSTELGNLLIGFLQTFGCIRDLSQEKIVLKGIDGSPGGFSKRDDRHVALWIDDPLRPGVNIGAGSYCMVHVQNAFKQMLQVLMNSPDVLLSLDCEDKDCQDLSVMSHFRYLRQLLKKPVEFQ